MGSTVTHTFRQSELLQFIIQSISSDAVFGSTGEDEGESCNGCLDVRVLILGICRQFTHLAILENGREHRVKGAGRVINPRLRACVVRGQLTKQANCGRRGRGASGTCMRIRLGIRVAREQQETGAAAEDFFHFLFEYLDSGREYRVKELGEYYSRE